MTKQAKNGWEVYQLLLGDGERGTATKYSVEEARRIRREEQRNAAKIEGCKEVFFMPMPIGNIMPDYDAKAGIRDYIRRLRPERYHHDAHRKHAPGCPKHCNRNS